MINLIKNGVEAIEERFVLEEGTGAAGVVRLEVVVGQQQLIIRVVDNGNGIDPAIRERLLQFGFTTKLSGSGFGLHAIGNFMNSVGGEFKIESAGVGQGATATLRFPL